jgi:glycosyltransferase involved in cell wall biosynthesis
MKRQNKLLVHAPNVHTGGGFELLKQVIKGLGNEVELNLDSRVKNKLAKSNTRINFVKPAIFSRLYSEWLLRKQATSYSTTLFFGNLPPVFKLRGKSVLFIQNRLLISAEALTGVAILVRLRLKVERFWLRRFIHNIAVVFVQTPQMKELLVKNVNLNQGKIRVYPFYDLNAVVVNLKKEYDFVYPASGDVHKNHKELINAWVLMAKEGLYPSLVITIDGKRYKDLLLWINQEKERYGLNIHNLGWVANKDDLILTYQKSRMMVFPSKSESFGLPLIEAKKIDMSIVASELDYVRDVCSPIETFDPDSSKSILRAIKRALEIEDTIVKVKSSKSFISEVIS